MRNKVKIKVKIVQCGLTIVRIKMSELRYELVTARKRKSELQQELVTARKMTELQDVNSSCTFSQHYPCSFGARLKKQATFIMRGQLRNFIFAQILL